VSMARLAAVILTLACSLVNAADLVSDKLAAEINFDIPAQALSASLKELASQAGIQILFEERIVNGLLSPALKSRASPSQALRILLDNTNLEYTAKDGTIVVRRKGRPNTASISESNQSLRDAQLVPTLDHTVQSSTNTESQSNTESQAAATAAPSTSALEEIVVTARKQAEDLQKAPAAITAVTGDTLAAMGVTDLSDISGLIPSTQIVDLPLGTHLYIRGIGSEQDRPFVNQLVATVIDGVYMPRETTNIGQFDVGQVEALPGPQGTLYGANAVGGVINITNNRPTGALESTGQLEVGNYAAVHGTMVQNIPLSDTVWVRSALDYNKHDDYQTAGADSLNAFGGRVSLLAMPTDDFTAYVWGSYNRDTGNPMDAVVTTANGPVYANPSNPWDATACAHSPCSFIPYQNIGPNRGDVIVSIVAGQFDWRFGSATLSLIPTYVDSSFDTVSYAGPISIYVVTSHTQYTNELRFTDDITSQLKLLSGLYWLHSRDYGDHDAGGGINPEALNYESDYAAYGQMTYSVLDNLRFTGGLRYAAQKKEDDFIIPALNPASHTWQPVDWKVGAEVDLAAHSMLYATVQTGFANGTFDSQNPLNEQPGYVKPTHLLSYTAGIKNRFLDGRLEVNDEVYYYDYKNYLIQTAIIANNGTIGNGFYTAPKVVDYGDQLDVRALITDSLQIQANFGYLHARAQEFTSAGETFSDYALFDSPNFTASIGAQYRWHWSNGADVTARVDSNYNSGYWANFPHEDGTLQEAFTKTSASLTYHAPEGRWSVGIYGKNLENEAQYATGGYVGVGVTQGLAYVTPPRTFGVRFTVSGPRSE
jgi:iron complex outermembrane receptor protein